MRSRETAANALAEGLRTQLRVFTLITNTLAKDKEISDSWRGFADVADGRHLSNRVERPVVDALVAAVTDAYPRLSHRWLRAAPSTIPSCSRPLASMRPTQASGRSGSA